MTVNVMVDIETLGTGNDALILSIGAVKFVGDSIIDRFHVAINPADAQNYGLKIDAATVMWWMSPERDEARKQLVACDKVDLYEALAGFAEWYGTESLPTWGNGATFDNVILRNAFTKARVECPWKFWHDRCYRTFKCEHPIPAEPRQGTHHNALDDAEYQANHLIKIWEML